MANKQKQHKRQMTQLRGRLRTDYRAQLEPELKALLHNKKYWRELPESFRIELGTLVIKRTLAEAGLLLTDNGLEIVVEPSNKIIGLEDFDAAFLTEELLNSRLRQARIESYWYKDYKDTAIWYIIDNYLRIYSQSQDYNKLDRDTIKQVMAESYTFRGPGHIVSSLTKHPFLIDLLDDPRLRAEIVSALNYRNIGYVNEGATNLRNYLGLSKYQYKAMVAWHSESPVYHWSVGMELSKLTKLYGTHLINGLLQRLGLNNCGLDPLCSISDQYPELVDEIAEFIGVIPVGLDLGMIEIHLEDSIRMIKELDTGSDYTVSDMLLHHQDIVDAYLSQKRREQNASTDELFNKRYDHLKSYEGQYDQYTFELPRSVEDLETEGKTMNNCVGSYVDLYASGNTNIIFMRYKGSPYVTIEWSGKDLKQALARFNKRLSNDQKDVVKSWANAHELHYNDCYGF